MPETHEELIQHLIKTKRLKTNRVIDAFKQVDRIHFVLPEDRESCYHDGPLSIGLGQTISQPTTVAIMMEELGVKSGDRVLDIGTGSGWTTALLGYMVREKGNVLGLERHDELVKFGNHNIRNYKIKNDKLKNSSEAPIRIEKAREMIGMKGQQFNRILVSAAAKKVPKELLDQIETGGRMVIPVGNEIHIIDRIGINRYDTKYLYGFQFVPYVIP